MFLPLDLKTAPTHFYSHNQIGSEVSILFAIETLDKTQRVELCDRTYIDLCRVLGKNGQSVSPEVFKIVAAAFTRWGHKNWLFVHFLKSGNEDLALKLISTKELQLNKTALITALWTGCTRVVQLILDQGMAIDQEVLEGVEFLNPGIVTPSKCLEIIKLLKSQNVDVHLAGSQFLKKLIAMGDSYIEVVRTILNLGVQPDDKKEGENTALTRACLMDDPPMQIIRLLVDRGANTYAKDQNGHSLIRQLIYRETFPVLAAILNRNEDEVQRFVKNYKTQFKLGHINSLFESKTMNYEGSWQEDMYLLLREILKTLPDSISRQISAYQKKQLINGFSKSKSNEKEILKAIRNGELVVVPHGSKKHASFFVFYNGYMLICDRDYEKTLDAFKIDPTKFTSFVLKRFMHYETKEIRIANRFYHQTLPAILSATDKKPEKDSICEQIEQFLSAKSQKIGNCAYVAAKLATRGALGLLQIKKGRKQTLVLKKEDALRAWYISKAISTHIRLQTLDDYYRIKQEGNEFFDEGCAQEALKLAFKHLKKTPEVSIANYPLVVQAIQGQEGENLFSPLSS